MSDRANLPPKRFIGLTLALTITIIVGICLLPHDRRLRFASLQEPAIVKAGWIYDRIHNDATPIDIVFVGSSHTVFGVDSAEIERNARRIGGQDVHVVNFALEHFGRNIPWLMAREAMETRRARLLVVELNEDELRALHPAFASLADPGDLLMAPLFINLSYSSDLAKLPLRQILLFLRTVLPRVFGAAPDFSQVQYRGAHWDDTWAEEGSAVAPVYPIRPRNTSPSAAEMQSERAHWEQLNGSKFNLPPPLSWLELRANFQYMDRIAALARQRGVTLRFLYLPTYQAQSRPTQFAVYEKLGPIWYPPPELLADRGLWLDVNHLNYFGAHALAAWLATQIAKERRPGVKLSY